MDNPVGRQNYIAPLQHEIIIGMLLGDGRLECRSKNNSARLRVHHGEKQKSLVEWKYDKLHSLVLRGPRRIKSWVNSKTGEDYFSWYFHTRTLFELSTLYKAFYKDKRKVVPRNIKKMITPLALAVWFMDDGCNHNHRIIFNTHSFTVKEQKRLMKMLWCRFYIKSHLVKDRDKFRIELDRNSVFSFLNLISGKIISSLQYKLSP